MKRLNKCLLATMLALSGLAGAITATAQNEKAKSAEAVSLSTLASRQLAWSTATSDNNFEWSAALRTVNDFNAVDWVGIRTQYLVNNFTWKYKNNEQNIVDSMTFTKMFFVADNSSVNLSMTLSTIVDGVEKKTQNIPITHLSYPTTHWLCDEVVTVTGLSSLVGNKDVTFKFQTSGGNAGIGFVKDDYFRVSGYASTKVTLDNQGGSDNSSVYLVEGYSMPNVSVPTKEDCEFDGYYSDVEGGGVKYYNADGTPALATAGNADTLYAKWNLVGTTITLDKDGGTGGDDSTLGIYDQTLSDISVPSKSGYTFNGYYEMTGGEGTQYYDANGHSSFVWNSTATSITFYASWTIKPAVQAVIDKINAIGTVSYPDSGDKINAARTAYNALESSDIGGVSNYSVLEAAETAYNNQKQAGADAVKDAIEAIGTVTLDKENKINTARAAYNALTPEQKDLVNNYSTLEAAEARLAELKEAKANADVVVDKINVIGEVAYPNSGDAIKAARDAYNALTNDDERGFVSNYQDLVDAEARYQELKEAKEVADPVNALIDAIGEVKYPNSKEAIEAARAAYNSLTNDDQRSFAHLSALESAENAYATLRTDAINSTKDLIDAIGTVSYPDSGDAIKAARDAYDSLHEADKSEITNYAALTAAEATYKDLKDQAQASIAKELINAIGTVSYPESNDAIKEARAAYESSSSDAKAHVDNLSVLEAAESEFESLRNAAIDHVEDLNDAIGTVAYPDSGASIKAARDAYDALLNEDKVLVSNYSVLEAAENAYASQKQAGVDDVEELINAIGTVTLDSKDAIKAARASYDALTEEQKALVDNYQTLLDAEVRLAELKEAKANADEVVALINQIGEVSYSGSKDAILAARAAYDALTTNDEKGFVTNYQTLLDAEARYEELKQSGAQSVKDLITSIGNVEYTEACKDKIDAARAAYDVLTDEQKALVNNYTTLTHDEEIYSHVEEVVKKIDEIGNVGLDSGEDIDAANEAYDSLTEEEKALIEDYHETLVNKEQTYTKIVHDHKVAVTCGIVFGILGGLILLVCGAWALMLFVFNKWIRVGDKAVRAFKLFGLKKKDGKFIVLAFPLKFIGKEDVEIFKTKEEALK